MKKLIITAAALILSLTASAKWVEQQTRTINNPVVHQGTTKSGNVKYYIVISDGVKDKEVSVSKGNASASQIVLVKWVDDETNKVRYSTRSAKQKQTTPNFDINKITTK